MIPCTCQLNQEGAKGGTTRRLPLLPPTPTAQQTQDSSVEPIMVRTCGVLALNGELEVLRLVTPLHNGNKVARRQVNRVFIGKDTTFEERVLQTVWHTSYVWIRS